MIWYSPGGSAVHAGPAPRLSAMRIASLPHRRRITKWLSAMPRPWTDPCRHGEAGCEGTQSGAYCGWHCLAGHDVDQAIDSVRPPHQRRRNNSDTAGIHRLESLKMLMPSTGPDTHRAFTKAMSPLSVEMHQPEATPCAIQSPAAAEPRIHPDFAARVQLKPPLHRHNKLAASKAKAPQPTVT